MAIECPKCHSENPKILKFCGECGTQLGEPEVDVARKRLEGLKSL